MLFSCSCSVIQEHLQLERRLEQMSLEKEQKISSLQKTVSDLTVSAYYAYLVNQSSIATATTVQYTDTRLVNSQ